MSPTLEKVIEGLALKEPRPTAAAVHRQAAVVASQLNEPVPSYRTVHLMIQGMDPALRHARARGHEIVQRPLRPGPPQGG